MMRLWILAAGLVLTAPLSAQGGQTGDGDRDYLINGAGGGEASYHSSSLVPGLEDFSNEYLTGTPLAPVLWLAAPNGAIDWVPNLQANSVDIGPQGLFALLDGTQPGFLGSVIRTGPDARFRFELPMDPALTGQGTLLAMAHLTPTSPDGFFISQTHSASFVPSPGFNCQPGAVTIVPGQVMNLGFLFPFYGTLQSQMFSTGVGAGVDFGAAASFFVTWDTILWAGSWPVPTACAYCGFGMNFGQGETVTFFTDNQGFAEVCWSNLAAPNGEQSWVRLTLILSQGQPLIVFEYGLVSTGGNPFAPMNVGLNPGVGGVGVPQQIDLTAGNNAFTDPNVIPFEMFGQSQFGPFFPSGPSDLRFSSVVWTLDANGFPVFQS